MTIFASGSPRARVATQRRKFIAGVAAALLIATTVVIWTRGGDDTAAAAEPTVVRSLVVLPPQGTDTALSYGVAHELAAALSPVGGIRVAAAPAALALHRRSPDDLRRLAALLNVGAVLHGGLDRVGDKVTLALELWLPADDSMLWSGRISRDTGDLAHVENEAAQSVAHALRAQLGLPKAKVVAGSGTGSRATRAGAGRDVAGAAARDGQDPSRARRQRTRDAGVCGRHTQ